MASTEPITAFKAHACVEIRCNVCGYVLDEDEDGIRHFDTRAEAVEMAEYVDWTATAKAVSDGHSTFDGYAICSTEDAVHDAARHWLAVRVPTCGAQVPADTAERLGADPETRCARVPGHVDPTHEDAVGNVMWIDRSVRVEVAK